MGEMIKLDEQIAELKRELAQRERVYARLIAAGKLKASVAQYQVACLEAALITVARVKSLDIALTEMIPDAKPRQMQ
jgi:hypothetical protein